MDLRDGQVQLPRDDVNGIERDVSEAGLDCMKDGEQRPAQCSVSMNDFLNAKVSRWFGHVPTVQRSRRGGKRLCE